MERQAYITPAIDICQQENCRLMANTLGTGDSEERGWQGARETNDLWGGEYFIEENEEDEEDFSWDDYHRPGIMDE